EVFYTGLRTQLNALLHPDYSDDEIAREVRNFGISEDPATHKLSLDEKGTVYNEMVSSMAKPDWILYQQSLVDLYGHHHPLSWSSGGLPEAIRQMKPADIRAFHDHHYFLANMGSVVSLPSGDTVAAQLARIDAILNAVQPNPVSLKPQSEADLPAPQPAPAGNISVVDFPFENDHQPSYVGFAWPAVRKLDNRDSLLFEIFANAFAGDSTTNLYKLFVNSRTRKMETGATGVNAWVSEDPDFPTAPRISKTSTRRCAAASSNSDVPSRSSSTPRPASASATPARTGWTSSTASIAKAASVSTSPKSPISKPSIACSPRHTTSGMIFFPPGTSRAQNPSASPLNPAPRFSPKIS